MTEIPKSSQLTYADAGVDIAAGNALVRRIKPLVAQTHRAGVLGSIGGFGGFFELPTERYRQPVMVSGTDGVGTKLRLAIELNLHDTIGIDLVAMCVNDVLVCGAEPLWFMDYLATSKLNVDQATRVVSGIAQGCKLAGAALLGGETAEMPGMYQPGDYDLAGFAVGVVEKDQIINGASVQAGDAIVGIASSGPHSNGYSLINHLLKCTAGTHTDIRQTHSGCVAMDTHQSYGTHHRRWPDRKPSAGVAGKYDSLHTSLELANASGLCVDSIHRRRGR